MQRSIGPVLVALLIVTAGCSALSGDGGTTVDDATTTTEVPGDSMDETTTEDSGDSTPTPTATATPTPTRSDDQTEAGSLRGVSGGKVTNHSAFTGAFYQHLSAGPVDFQMSYTNTTGDSTQTIDYVFRNDTDQQLYNLSQSSAGYTEYYVTSGADGVRNTTSGEIQYGQGESRIQTSAAFTRLITLVPGQFIASMEWEVSGTETVDGREGTVLTSDSFNQTAANNSEFALGDQTENVSSVSGRLVVASNGLILDGEITAEGTENGESVQLDLTITMRESGVEVEQPDWFDEDEAQSG